MTQCWVGRIWSKSPCLAQGAAMRLLAESYTSRDQVSLIPFYGDKAEVRKTSARFLTLPSIRVLIDTACKHHQHASYVSASLLSMLTHTQQHGTPKPDDTFCDAAVAVTTHLPYTCCRCCCRPASPSAWRGDGWTRCPAAAGRPWRTALPQPSGSACRPSHRCLRYSAATTQRWPRHYCDHVP